MYLYTNNSLYQLPALHLKFPGGLAFDVETQGETVVGLTSAIPFHSIDQEKYTEQHGFLDTLTFFRTETGSYSFSHTLAFLEGMESILEIPDPPRFQYLRVLFSEVEHIQARLLNLGAMAKGLGVTPLPFYVKNFHNQLSSVTRKIFRTSTLTSLLTLGGLTTDCPQELLDLFIKFLNLEVPPLVTLFEKILLSSGIVRDRTSQLGILTREDIESFGLSGPNARAAGVPFDLRQFGGQHPIYSDLRFTKVLGSRGDALARMILRKEEILQSLDLINQCQAKIPKGTAAIPGKAQFLMKTLCSLHSLDTPVFPACSRYQAVESPNGEFSVYLFSDGHEKLHRCRIKDPSFNTLRAFEKLAIRQNLTDLELLLISLDLLWKD